MSALSHHWNDLQFDWLWVYDGMVPATDVWSKEIVAPASVFFVLSGKGQIRAGDGVVSVPAGSAFLAAAGTRRQWFADGTRLLSVAFRAIWPEGKPLSIPGLNIALDEAVSRDLCKASKVLFEHIHGRRKTVGFREATQAQAMDLASWCKRETAFRAWFEAYAKTLLKLGLEPSPRHDVADDRVREIVRRLDSWPLRHALNLGELCHGLGFGSRRLEQLAVAELGHTPHAYLNRRRVESARLMLASSAMPLKQIAHDIGLRHASHFTKWFRRHTGLAPSTYRHRTEDFA